MWLPRNPDKVFAFRFREVPEVIWWRHDTFIKAVVNCCFITVVVVVLEFYGPVNNEVISSRSVNSGTVPGQA